ncbi:hypothetical protein SAMN04488490_1973 [Marinobacter sp. LV10R510-11A]|uniref:hypothetical protein n=1 Tax=Marinobacter sp. LV10R510-11A TaxID=1415568 RepID=UPI000BB78BF2|nr:hypothetical protein [Marinobacter sp. LV10R510-11A]SOB76289.1 hypothetical protein SAMN04488490_1973 [Marinobacter sp. LV10R510-11A]
MNIHSGFTFRSDFAVRFVSFVFGTTLALLISSSALAADTASEVKTAAMHAGLASQAANVEGVHTHLHHTLNCLVGPDGDGFDSDEMNPCGDMGNGAIPDTKDDDMKKKLESAVDKANSGLDADDYDEAKTSAMSVQKMLEAK